MVRLAPKHLHGDYGLFQLIVLAIQMTFGEEPEKPAHPLITEETGARKKAFQLATRRLRIWVRGEHHPRISPCFQGRANV